MVSAAEIVARIAEERRKDESQHPAGFYELVLQWLNDPDEEIRYESVMFLGRHLRAMSDAQILLEMLTADPSARIRKEVAGCLGGVFRNTHDRRVLSVLVAVSQDTDEDGLVRQTALAAIRRINSQRF